MEDIKKEKKETSVTDIKPGMMIKIYQKIKEPDAKGNMKERIQIFEGMVISRHGGNTPGATFTVSRKAADNIGVEKIYPLYSPTISKIEIVKKFKVRRAKLNFLKDHSKKLKEVK
ncbi:MAG: 50S ribosomal protein L19 [Patescibacteria group bacterium]|nr:50S ribosomal protein L19 [Patescibacteria group bacterium]